MNISRGGRIRLLGLLILLIAFGIFATWFAPQLGDAGKHLHQFLERPFFTMGGLPVTAFFLMKVAIFIVLLLLVCHFTMTILENRILTYMPLEEGQRYAIARVTSYLLFVLGMVVGLQSLGVNLDSLVVVGGALGIGVGLGLQAIVSNLSRGWSCCWSNRSNSAIASRWAARWATSCGCAAAAPGFKPTTTW